jgi:CheY-like chemotaxis protein
MPDLSNEIVRQIPFLRRYARALTGTQGLGDYYVKACLEALLDDSTELVPDMPVRLQIFRHFHATFAGSGTSSSENPAAIERASAMPVQQHLAQLPSMERQVLLLSTIEGYSAEDIAYILGISMPQAHESLERAKTELMKQARTTVLVIEDEPIIAFDIAGIVTEMGHRVVATASTKAEAVAAARDKKPALILADIQLDDGSSGIDAVAEILEAVDVPVIFVTAFPERLLTGEKTEPTFLVTKPFEPDVLKITIAQALYTRRETEHARAAG